MITIAGNFYNTLTFSNREVVVTCGRDGVVDCSGKWSYLTTELPKYLQKMHSCDSFVQHATFDLSSTFEHTSENERKG